MGSTKDISHPLIWGKYQLITCVFCEHGYGLSVKRVPDQCDFLWTTSLCPRKYLDRNTNPTVTSPGDGNQLHAFTQSYIIYDYYSMNSSIEPSTVGLILNMSPFNRTQPNCNTVLSGQLHDTGHRVIEIVSSTPRSPIQWYETVLSTCVLIVSDAVMFG